MNAPARCPAASRRSTSRPAHRPPEPGAAQSERGSTAWLEAQYDNRRRVPESAGHLQRWAVASALTRDRMVCLRDEPYGDHPAERLDVFPSLEPGAPVLVFLHGGYWRALDKSDHSFLAPSFVQAGAAVVVPNYALCPAVSIDEIALQCARAVAWTWRHAERFGGDPSHLVVVGHSAGGQLAAMLAACRWADLAPDLPASLLRAAVAVSGLFDLAPLQGVPSLQKDLHLTDETVARCSPVRWPAPQVPVSAVVGGLESEAYLAQTTALREAWGPRSVPVCEAVPGHDHFSILTDLVDPDGVSHAVVRRALGLRPAGTDGPI